MCKLFPNLKRVFITEAVNDTEHARPLSANGRKPSGPGTLGLFAALLFCSLMWTGAKAQLSGTYTINGSGGNYTSIGAAVNDLLSKGVSGPVVFNVAAGTYTETAYFSAFSGSSATNTVTFKGAGRGKTIIQNSSYVILFNGCSYVTFDGFTISNTSSSYTVFGNYAQYCSVKNSNLFAPTSSGSQNIVDQYDYNFSIINCNIQGGYYGIYMYGSPGNLAYSGSLYKNNRITNFGYYATYMYYGNNNTFDHNVIDSSINGYGYGFYSWYESGGSYINNTSIAKLYYAMYYYYMNEYSSSTPFKIVNNIVANEQWYNFFMPYYASNITIAHNDFNCLTEWGVLMEAYGSSNVIFADNLVTTQSSSYTAVYFEIISSTPSSTFSILDGNNYQSPGANVVEYYNGSSSVNYATVALWQKAMATTTYTNPFNGSTNPMEGFATSSLPSYINAKANNYHLVQTVTQPSGVYAGVDVDIDGDARCKLFPTAGADESTFGKSKPIVNFFLPSSIYPNSPTTIYQTAKAGEPKLNYWYLNGVLVSDSVVLFTNKFVTGTNTLKLVTKSCGGNDSVQKTFTVAPPTAVPGTDFIASKNTIKQGDFVTFHDLSTNGPTTWQWSVSPDSVINSGVKVPAIQYVFGSSTYQNPSIQFNAGGKYKICLTTSNSVGKGSAVCKTNYITVVPAINMGSVSVVHDASGYLYDNGGPNNPYHTDAANTYTEQLLIDPCADSVYLTFSQFDTYCGYDYVRLFQGRNNAGPNISGKCTTNGTYYTGGGGGFGFSGGSYSGSCTYTCMPNVVKPDTFKAKTAMFVEMNTYEGFGGSQGFAAYWWSKPKTSVKPTASFTTSNAGDSICVNGALNYTNTTKIDPNDPATFLWDLDGDITTFECIGTCATSTYPYFTPGPVTVTLIATNCGGSDTARRTLTVFAPAAPKAAFTADNVTPTTNDVVYFTSTVAVCVDDYKWTITPSAGTTGAGVFVNGSSNVASNPQVNFTGNGFYDVRLYVDNSAGKDSITKAKYIDARNAYCIPSVATTNPALGISGVQFNTISNTTTPAASEYTNNVPNQTLSTSLAVGATYSLTVTRDASAIFDPMNRAAYIDWNGDGSFVGAGEIYQLDSNSFNASVTKKITVPKTAKIGATVLRIAANLYKYANKPCGQNEFGEYQDYRLYITPYNILPVITLKGIQGLKDTIKLEQGYTWTDPGYSASSFLYGDITKQVVITTNFSNVIPGTYIVSYDVTDSTGNKAITQKRVIKVTPDATPPNLLVNGPDTTYIEVTKFPQHPVPVPTVISAIDLVDGPLTNEVFIDSAKVQTNIVGTYIVSYSVSDITGNTATVYRAIIVIDTIPPVLHLLGADPLTLEVFNTFVDPGVTASDNYYTSGSLNPAITVTGNVDNTTLGSYTITYTLTDGSGNKAIPVTRTVNVVDTIAPVISLNGAPTDSVAVFTSYKDPGVTVSDNYDKTGVIVTTSGSFITTFGTKNPNVTGSAYQIIYTATDKSGNKASVTRTVKVQDRTAPVIVLKGDAALSICRWGNYVSPGYSVSDNYDAPNQVTVDSEGSFLTQGGTTMFGLYDVRYKATDRAGNISYSPYRYIQVIEETDFKCESSVAPNLGLDKYINVYPNPTSGLCVVDVNLPGTQQVRMSITNMLGQEISVVHTGIIGKDKLTVDLSNEKSGVYFLNIVSDHETLVKRIELTK